MNTDAEIRIRVQQQFGRVARAYQTSPTFATGIDLELLLKLAAVRPGERALDVATGAGHTAKRLAQQGAHVIALDLTPSMLHVARETLREAGSEGNCLLLAGDAIALPFRSDSMTLVTCRIAPHHFSSPHHFLAEVARVLQPGGRFILVDNLGPDDPALAHALDELERQRDPSHVHSLSRRAWLDGLRTVGLVPDVVMEVQRWHNWKEWTERSGMTSDQRAELEAWFLSQPALLAYLGAHVEEGSILGFRDDKLIVRAWRR